MLLTQVKYNFICVYSVFCIGIWTSHPTLYWDCANAILTLFMQIHYHCKPTSKTETINFDFKYGGVVRRITWLHKLSLSKFIILNEFNNHATNALTKLVCRSTQWYPYPSQQFNCLIVMPIMLQQPGWLCQCMASTAHLVHSLGFYPCIHHALCVSLHVHDN